MERRSDSFLAFYQPLRGQHAIFGNGLHKYRGLVRLWPLYRDDYRYQHHDQLREQPENNHRNRHLHTVLEKLPAFAIQRIIASISYFRMCGL